MNFIKNGQRHNHRGIVGIEAAIVLIAFVLIAATLTYVVLNSGFASSQTAKTTIGSTLDSSASLEVEGKVIASAYSPSGGTRSLNITSIPIKTAGAGDSVNLNAAITAVKYLSNSITYDNIYNGTLNAKAQPTYNSLESATNAAATYDVSTGGKLISLSPFNGGDANLDDWPFETVAFIYWTSQANTNDILETGEHANLAIAFAAGDRPEYLDKIRIELIQASGGSLVVERTIPIIENAVVDLG